MDFSSLLEFSAADLKLQSPEEAARCMRVAPGFVRLCLDAGMPTRSSLVSAALVFEWLLTGYPALRELAGMKPLPAVDQIQSMQETNARQSCAVLTMLEYSAARASLPDYCQEIEGVCASIRKALGIE